MNNYSKTKSMIFFIIFGLIFAIGAVLTFVPMRFGSKDYESFIGAMALSTDCNDTISAVYTYTEDDTTDVERAIKLMGSSLEQRFGKNSVNVYKLGDKKIKVEVADGITEDRTNEIKECLSGFTAGKMTITNNKNPKATLEENPDLLVIDGWTDIESVSTKNYKGSYGIEVTFTKSGKSTYELMTGQTVYIYINGKAFPSDNYNSVALTTETTTFTIWFSTNEYIDYYKTTFEAGMIPLHFEEGSLEYTYADKNPLVIAYFSIAMAALVFALYVFAVIKFRMPAVFYVVLSNIATFVTLFLLQSMPWVEIGIVSIITVGIAKILEFLLFATVQNRVKEEYMLGKTLETSYEDAYKRITPVFLDVLLMALFGGIALAISGNFELVTIGTVLALSSVLNGLVILFGNRFLTNCYFAFNQTKMSCYALPNRMEGNSNE